METVSRFVKDLGASERTAVERLIGHSLAEDQQLIIQVVGVGSTAPPESTLAGGLPAWCNIYDGLSDAEIAELESSIVRCNASRSFE